MQGQCALAFLTALYMLSWERSGVMEASPMQRAPMPLPGSEFTIRPRGQTGSNLQLLPLQSAPSHIGHIAIVHVHILQGAIRDSSCCNGHAQLRAHALLLTFRPGQPSIVTKPKQ